MDRWAVILADRRGHVTSWSGAAAEILDLPADAALGRPLDQLLIEEQGRQIAERLTEACENSLRPAPVLEVRPRPRTRASPERPERQLRLTFVRATGERIALILGERGRSAPAPVPGDRCGVLEEVGQQVSDGVVLATADLRGEGPHVVYANAAACRLLATAAGSVTGAPLLSLLAPETQPGLRTRVHQALLEGAEDIHEQVVVEAPEGGHTLVEWRIRAVRTPEGAVTHFVAVLRDVTDDAVRGGAYRGALIDPLTGLPNRQHFLERVSRSVGWAGKGDHYAFTVLGFDLVGLPEVERRWGAAVAHVLVEALAWRVRRCLRPNDLVARLGHARVAVLMEHFAEEWDRTDLLARIRREVSIPFVVGGHRIAQGVSGGALPVMRRGHLPGDAEAVVDLLEHALSSPGEDASPGFLRLRVGEGIGSPVSGSVGLDLRRAVSSGELHLRYQPIIDLGDGRVHGLEALLTWRHPSRGLLPAREFLHHAAGTGLLPTIGAWVAKQACGDLGLLRRRVPGLRLPPIHINLSAAEFWDPDPIARLMEALDGTELEPSAFRLEVSEGTLSRNPAAASLLIERLAEVGFELWLEGFGGERLSLRDVLWMPFRHLKLDSGLFWEDARCGGRLPSPYLLELARLAQDLGRRVVVGTVETLSERERLRPECCALAQGTFFGGPVEPADLPDLVIPR